MKRELIDELLRHAPTMNNEVTKAVLSDQPVTGCPHFLECQVIFGGGLMVAGVLTDAYGHLPDDTLRLLTPAKRGDNSVILADHYFTADDIVTIVIARDLPRMTTIIRSA